MAVENVRKSGRVRAKKASYFDDFDLDTDMGPIHVTQTPQKSTISKSKETPQFQVTTNNHNNLLSERDVVDNHANNVSKLKGYICDVCKTVHMDEETHQRHLRLHTEDRPFKCECGKTFRDSHSLKRHQKSHDDQFRPYVCDICFKSFKDSSSCARHQKTHINQPRSFQCDKCEKNFTDKHGLRRHEKSHLGLKPFECDVCGKSFGDAGSFRRHQRIHLGVRNFQCWKCKRRFLEKQSLMRHMKNVCGFNGNYEQNMDFSFSDIEIVKDVSQLQFNESLAASDTIFENVQQHPKINGLEPEFRFNDVKSNDQKDMEIKDILSPESLLKKDPDLSENITELVKSFDSFETMMNMCKGQDESGLEHFPPMPDHLKHGTNIPENSYSETHRLVEHPNSLDIKKEDSIENTYNATLDAKIMEYLNRPSITSPVFTCQYCVKVFKTSQLLNEHIELHHTDYVSKKTAQYCQLCNKSFGSASSLKRHLIIHTGHKPYACPKCQRRFRDPSNFCKHKKNCASSLGLNPLQPTSCNASTQQWFMCPKCETQFKDIDSLSKHESVCCIVLSEADHGSDVVSSIDRLYDTKYINCNDDNKNMYEEDEEDGDTNLIVSFETGRKDSICKIEIDIKDRDGKEHNELLKNVKEMVDKGEIKEEIQNEICYEEKTTSNMSDESLNDDTKMHLNNKGGPNATCIECGKQFFDSFGLKRHMRTHAGIRPFTCRYCSQGYCDNWSLKKHLSRGCVYENIKVPASQLYQCPECMRMFSLQIYLEEHIEKSHAGRPLKFECDICDNKFSEAANLKRHRRLLHMSVCTQCDREFKDVQSLQLHLTNDCPGNQPVHCPEESQQEGFRCSECGKLYATKAYLERHKKFHSELKPYKCEICSKRFTESFGLKRHMRTHSNEPGNYANIKVKKEMDDIGFHFIKTCRSTPNQDRKHDHPIVRKKTPLRSTVISDIHLPKSDTKTAKFQCGICYKMFQKNYMLMRHMNVHSQDRPYTCDFCSKSYKDTSSLRRHQLTHKGTRDFICTVCGKEFLYADSLRRHMRESCKIKSPRDISAKQKTSDLGSSNDNLVQATPSSGKLCIKLFKLNSETSYDKKSFYSLGNALQHVHEGHWSCYGNCHCWLCDLRFTSKRELLLHHKRTHLSYKAKNINFFRSGKTNRYNSNSQRKRFKCKRCFMRFTCKIYWKSHQKNHSLKGNSPSIDITQPSREMKVSRPSFQTDGFGN